MSRKPWTPLEIAAKWLPGLLLCLVVANHAHRVSTTRLNPHVGGGFGMFSTTDRSSSRAFYAEGVDTDGNRRPILLDFDGEGSLDELSMRTYRRIRAMPDDESLDRLAETIYRARYRVENPRVFANVKSIRQTLDRLPPGTLDEPYFRSLTPEELSIEATAGIRLRGIRFQIRRVRFDSVDVKLTTVPYTPWIVKGDW